jgi:SOS-response transcriptional repressor LexA
MTLKGKRKEKGIVIKENTLWTKLQMAVFAYFIRNHNQPETYREIARAYGKSNYTDYKKACDILARKGYLVKLEDGKFRISDDDLEFVKKGKESVERDLPYLQSFLKILKTRNSA